MVVFGGDIRPFCQILETAVAAETVNKVGVFSESAQLREDKGCLKKKALMRGRFITLSRCFGSLFDPILWKRGEWTASKFEIHQ